jgi:ribonuclease P protein component
MGSARAWPRATAGRFWRGGGPRDASVCRRDARRDGRWGGAVERLKRRGDFVAAGKGRKIARRGFLLQARNRGDDGPPRFGFTVSKRIAARAVERNRIRRRLKEAARLVGPQQAKQGYDYVLVARRPALHMRFADMTGDLAESLQELRAAQPTQRPGGNPAGGRD